MVIKNKRRKNFTTIPNEIINHTGLVPLSRLAVIYILSKPEDWEVRMVDLRKYLGVGRDLMRKIMRNIVDNGYADLKSIHGDKGQFIGSGYYFYDSPCRETENQSVGDPTEGRVSRLSVEPSVGQSVPLIKTDNILNTESILNTEELQNQDFAENDSKEKENTPTKQLEKSTPPPSAAPPSEPFGKIEGLKKRIGPKHYVLINELAREDKECHQLMRELFNVGPSNEENAFWLFVEWLEYKKDRRQTYSSPKYLKTLLNKQFKDFLYEEIKDAIDTATGSQYTGVFTKQNKALRQDTTPVQVDQSETNLKALLGKRSKLKAI